MAQSTQICNKCSFLKCTFEFNGAYFCAMPLNYFIKIASNNNIPTDINTTIELIEKYRKYAMNRAINNQYLYKPSYWDVYMSIYVNSSTISSYMGFNNKFNPIKRKNKTQKTELYAVMNPLLLNNTGDCIFYKEKYSRIKKIFSFLTKKKNMMNG